MPLPEIHIKKDLTDDGLVVFSRKEFEDLRDAYYELIQKEKNNPNVGERVKRRWEGAHGVLFDICSLWTPLELS